MKKALLALLVFALVAPASLLLTPRPAHAQLFVQDPFNLVQNTISAVANPSTAASTYWTALKGSVLDPLAHALAQAVLKQVTASVVNSINGVNGQPQFVQSLALNLQMTGDQVGLAFISQFNSAVNSPFAPAIANSMQQNYAQQTSLAGFFAANECSLVAGTINYFLTGNFSQGGWGSWFAVTGTSPNNPYILNANANAQLASVVGSAQANQSQTIAQNNGFLSWCPSGTTSGSAGAGQACTFTPETNSCPNQLVCTPGAGQTGTTGTGTCAAPTAATSDATEATCYNANGTPAAAQTPGSVIESTLTTTLGSGVQSLVSVHDFNQAIDTILSALATKVVTTGLTALSGGSSDSPGNLQNTGGATGSTDPNASSIASQATSQAQTTISQLSTYTSNWQTLQSAAETASTSVLQLIANCPTLASSGQEALTNEIQPVIIQATNAFTTAASTQALATQVESDAAAYQAGDPAATAELTADSQALSSAPPSATDIANAQSGAQVTHGATSSAYSLDVSGGTTVDQMNLIAKLAQTLEPLCGPPLPL
jgi:hypothetical protein